MVEEDIQQLQLVGRKGLKFPLNSIMFVNSGIIYFVVFIILICQFGFVINFKLFNL